MATTRELFREAAKAQGISGVDFTPPTDHQLLANGVRLHYVDWGGKGFPILFLHGGGQTCRTWDMTIAQIRKKYRCYALDQRNHGHSEKVPDFNPSPEATREDVRGVVEALGLKQFVLVGMSMGGLNTIAYSAKYPKELKAVVIVDVTPTIKRRGANEISNFSRPVEWSSIDEAVAAAIKFNPLRPSAHLRYSLTHSLRQRDDGKWVWKHARPDRAESQSEQERKQMAVRREALWKGVPKISCPTLVCHGSKSKVIDRKLAERLAHTLPQGEVVTIKGASHTVQGDKPKEFVAALTKFLAQHNI